LRTAIHATTKASPALVMFGRELSVAVDHELLNKGEYDEVKHLEMLKKLPDKMKTIVKWITKNIKETQEGNKERYDKSHQPHSFKTGDLVWMKNHELSKKSAHKAQKLLKRWIGPYELGTQTNEVTFELLTVAEKRSIGIRHVCELKPFIGELGEETS